MDRIGWILMNLIRFSQIFFLFLIFSSLCFGLHQIDSISPVMASSLVGLLGCLLASKKMYKDIEIIAYCGSFSGMSSHVFFSDWWILIISSFLGSVMLILLEKWFIGWGGKLGAIAFISLVVFGL